MMTNPQGKKYIGQHNGKKKNYRGSGRELDKTFTKRILLYCESADLNRNEEALITAYDTYYNGCNRTPYAIGFHNPRWKMSAEQKRAYSEKLRKCNKGGFIKPTGISTEVFKKEVIQLGNIALASRKLGIGFSTIHSRFKKENITCIYEGGRNKGPGLKVVEFK